MSLTETTNSKVSERIADFHEYIKMVMSVDSAKKMILEDTCLNAVIEYINNFK